MPANRNKFIFFTKILAMLLELIFNPNKTFSDTELAGVVGWRRRWTKSTEPEKPINPLIQGVDQLEGSLPPMADNFERQGEVKYAFPKPTRIARLSHFVILCVIFAWLCLLILGIFNLDMDTLTISETAKQLLGE